jgi:hypothetical protein
VRGNKLPVIGFFLALVLTATIWYATTRVRTGQKPWNSSAITATYVGAQFRELDSANAALYLAYEIQNNTDSDYRLADGHGAMVMGSQRADGSQSTQEQVRLSYLTFFLWAGALVEICARSEGRGKRIFGMCLENFESEAGGRSGICPFRSG